MTNRFHFLILLVLPLFFSCKEKQPVKVTLIQMNDVYEFGPLEAGEKGGLARVAQLKKDLIKENPNTFLIISGDFLSPSLYANMRNEDGEKIAGQQMIEVLNAIGTDIATFGNHEFDIKQKDLQKRLNESEFDWTSVNVFEIKDGNKAPFHKNGIPIPKHLIKTVSNQTGQKAKIGFIGNLLPFNKRGYVHYEDEFQTFSDKAESLKDSVDVILGITHLLLEGDRKLAGMLNNVPLLMGGHDHDNIIDTVGNTVITKADANAKSVYVHRVSIFPGNPKKTTVHSELVKITPAIKTDSTVWEVAEKWQKSLDSKMHNEGFSPYESIATIDEELEGRESVIRHQPANLPKLICRALLAADEKADLAIINSGCVRIDDVIRNRVLEIDILKSLLFGGGITAIPMSGEQIHQLMEIGLNKNKGTGGYLQYENLEIKEGKFFIKGIELNKKKKYRVLVPEFVGLGLEQNLDFLGEIKGKKNQKTIGKLAIKNDVRHIVIEYLKNGGK